MLGLIGCTIENGDETGEGQRASGARERRLHGGVAHCCARFRCAAPDTARDGDGTRTPFCPAEYSRAIALPDNPPLKPPPVSSPQIHSHGPMFAAVNIASPSVNGLSAIRAIDPS